MGRPHTTARAPVPLNEPWNRDVAMKAPSPHGLRTMRAPGSRAWRMSDVRVARGQLRAALEALRELLRRLEGEDGAGGAAELLGVKATTLASRLQSLGITLPPVAVVVPTYGEPLAVLEQTLKECGVLR